MMSRISDDKRNGSIFGGMVLNGGNDTVIVMRQEYLITDKLFEASNLVFFVQIK